MDSIFAEFELIGHPKSDETKKTKALFLIGDDLATMAELLGGGDDVTYLEFQTAMLKRDRERRKYVVTRDRAFNGRCYVVQATSAKEFKLFQQLRGPHCTASSTSAGYRWSVRCNRQTIIARLGF